MIFGPYEHLVVYEYRLHLYQTYLLHALLPDQAVSRILSVPQAFGVSLLAYLRADKSNYAYVIALVVRLFWPYGTS
jgi:hypothetical protein